MKISSKIWKIVWVSGIYAILLTILYLVIVYKVKWEDKDLNTYLYFYDCGRTLCTSSVEQRDYYGKVLCENDICPYVSKIIGNNLILNNDGGSWIYNYLDNKIVNNKYSNYTYIGNDRFVVKDNTDNYGVIDLDGNILVDFKYQYIDNFYKNFIVYKKNNLYGIDHLDDEYEIDAKFQDIVLINEKIFAGMKDNEYYLYSYSHPDNDNANKYNYVYSYNDIVLVANNNKIDILNANLNSTLLMKIDSFYAYKTEKERDSLNLYFDNDYIYFDVFVNETEFISYKYSITDKKLV